MAHHFTEDELRHLKVVFSDFDKDGDGAISSRDLEDAVDSFKHIVPGLRRFFNSEMMEELIQEIDTDKDGKVSYEEFLSMLANK